LCQWTSVQKTYYTDGQRKVLAELEREHAEGSCHILEIPFYQGWMRASCQQVICMPVATWETMYRNDSRYEPTQIDRTTAKRLTTRLAQVFNTSPWALMEFLHDSPSWSEAIVWRNSQRGLTCSIDMHGMTDRLEDEYGQCKDDADKMECPDWRYKGFGGQIRVTLEDGTPWYVTILAPTHFIRCLMSYAQWFEPATATETPPTQI
jgi:hypothetical protein